MSEENFRRFIFFLEKTYAFCNEINQIEPWQTRWAKILAITKQSGKKGEKGSFFDLSKSYFAPNVGGVEESGNNFGFIIIFLFLYFNTSGVLKSVRVYLFATFLFG